MKYIELTERNSDRTPVIVNLEQVTTISPNANGSHIIFTAGRYVYVAESYEEVLRRISEVNDKQFCLDRKPTAAQSDDPNLSIKSAQAIYTGGGQWEFIGELKDGSFFKAYDSDAYEVHLLDSDPSINYEDSCTFEWLNDHTFWTYCEDETETLDFFDRLYRSFREDDFIDRNYHIEMLSNYRDWRKDNGLNG